MSGFKSKAEASLCMRRGIDDRREVERHLTRLGASADAVLGLVDGYAARVIERRSEINSRMLVALFGAAGRKLREDVAVAEVTAAVRKSSSKPGMSPAMAVPPGIPCPAVLPPEQETGDGRDTGSPPSGCAVADAPPVAGGEAVPEVQPPETDPRLTGAAVVTGEWTTMKATSVWPLTVQPAVAPDPVPMALADLRGRLAWAQGEWDAATARAREAVAKIDKLTAAIAALEEVAA